MARNTVTFEDTDRTGVLRAATPEVRATDEEKVVWEFDAVKEKLAAHVGNPVPVRFFFWDQIDFPDPDLIAPFGRPTFSLLIDVENEDDLVHEAAVHPDVKDYLAETEEPIEIGYQMVFPHGDGSSDVFVIGENSPPVMILT